MLKRFIIFIVIIFVLLPDFSNSSDKTIHVLVLPFDIHAVTDLAYMKDQISKIIEKQLHNFGIEIIKPEMIEDITGGKMLETIEEIRNIGIKTGADFVVWGSMTWIGGKFSLDGNLLESYGEKSPKTFFVSGRNIENIPVAVKKLADDFSMKIFRHEKVFKVVIKGNKRIEEDAIKRIIKTKPKDMYSAKRLSEDLKSVYGMGYFDDIRIETEDTSEGKKIIFIVKEKPTIRIIHFKGNKIYKDDEIKENLTIKTGSILNIYTIKSNVKIIEDLYKDKNYHNVKVSYRINLLEHNQADLRFFISEGNKIFIKSIKFEGNKAYSDRKLKKLMKSSEKGFLSWITSSGDFKKEDLEQDAGKIAAFYHNNGYIKAKVGEPQIQFKENGIYVKIKIDEGLRYKVGKIGITGDLIIPKDELLKKLKVSSGTYYDREVIRKDVINLTDLYSDKGYAYAQITPRIEENTDKLIVNLTYVIEKEKQVHFEKIIIGGNTKTRDKVIRRELRVYEQELYSGKALKRSIRNLYRLDYFEDIKVNTQKGSTDDSMILKLNVTEKPTGSFSVGGGYSSVESVFAMGSVEQRNLFGRGQILQFQAQIGGTSTRYTISFTEPWLFDIPLTAGFDLYNWNIDYDTYDKDSFGGGLRFSYPIIDFVRAYLKYNYDDAQIKNISYYAAQSIKDLSGSNITSSVTMGLRYDSRDRIINAKKGSEHSISVEYAGLGGNVGFTKLRAETGWYIPLFLDTTGFLHGKTGYVTKTSGKDLPDYERFYLGGINSLRGFGWRGVHALDKDGNEIGGNKFVQFNIEYLIPLLKKTGLVGVVFYDTGDVYGNNESMNFGKLRQSAGYGFRWYSPMGPIRIENGIVKVDLGGVIRRRGFETAQVTMP